MRKRILCAVLALLMLAGVSPAGPARAHDDPPPSASPGKASGESEGKDPPDPLKFGPVKLGLDTLLRPETTSNFSLGSFSYTPGNDESRILFRLRPSVTVAPSESFSARVEGQWYAFRNDTDFSIFSLYQGYAEGVVPGVKGISLKAGRQELVYGSTFLLGADTFYDGLVFDAAKLSWKPAEKFLLDMFGGQYVKKWSGGIEGKLYGIYAAYALKDTLSIDSYWFRDTGGAGATHVGGEHEVTYSVGTRLSGRIVKNVVFEVEPVYQFGRKNRDGVGHNHISAYGGHADITLDAPLGGHPGKVFLMYAYGSGDANTQEGKFTEFHNPNNDTPLIGDMNVIGDLSGLSLADSSGNEVRASGLHVLTIGGGVDLTDKLNLSLDGHYFRANKVPAGVSKEIGIETNLILTCKIRENVSVLLSGNRFFTGDFFRDVTGSGKDINYVYAQLQATF
jgi:hypothetical protein